MTPEEPDGILATYFLETVGDAERVISGFAGELSTGTFVELPAETAQLLEASAARVVYVERTEPPASAPSLPTRSTGAPSGGWTVTVAVPVANVGADLPALAATLAGNVFELGQLGGIRLIDVEFPSGYRDRFTMPAFGVTGTRAMLGVEGRPLFGSIVKPSVGLSPQDTADLVYELAVGGLDFVKDDELQANGASCPFEERFRAVSAAIERAADRTGRRMLYAYNVTDDWDAMLRHCDLVNEATGVIMLTVNTVGLVATAEVVRRSAVPVHAHRAGWGLLGRSPHLGMTFTAFQKLWRLTGIDHLHTSGLGNKFFETDEIVTESVRACLTPSPGHDDRVLPVLSSAQTCLQVGSTLDAVHSEDFLMLAGGGIIGHPMGAAAGVQSFHDAYDAHVSGESLLQRARVSAPLREALAVFGDGIHG